MPKVSVIIPVFGVERFISRCAVSLFEQTLDDIEYIFIDDCSTDNSLQVLLEILEKYPHRVEQTRIVKMQYNTGQAGVRRYGVSIASGEYLAFCDSDDWVSLEMYRSMYDYASQGDYDMVVCDFVSSGDGKEKVHKGAISSTDRIQFLKGMLTYKNSWSLCNKLVRRELFYQAIEFFPVSNQGEDMSMVIQLTYGCKRIGYINSAYYFYFQNPESITKKVTFQSYKNRYVQFHNNLTTVCTFLVSKGEYKQLRSATNALRFFGNIKLWPLIKEDKSYYLLWDVEASYLFWKIIFSRHITTRNKGKYLLTCLRVYPKKK
jgi:glycosyltransferase involved in cell wall biosynthesis